MSCINKDKLIGHFLPWQKSKFLSARERVSTQCCIHTVEYYSASEMDGPQKQAIIWLSLDMLVGGCCVNYLTSLVA